MRLSKLIINPENPFPFRGDEKEWLDFREKVKRDPDFLALKPIVYDSSDIIDKKFKIIAGNKRYQALTDLEYKTLKKNWHFDCKDWPDEKKRRYELIDNWHVFGSEWDPTLMSQEEMFEWIEMPQEPLDPNNSIQGPDASPSVAMNYLKFGKHQIPISDEELEALTKKLTDYIDTFTVTMGFVNHLINED